MEQHNHFDRKFAPRIKLLSKRGRAVIVVPDRFGKGLVQAVFDNPDLIQYVRRLIHKDRQMKVLLFPRTLLVLDPSLGVRDQSIAELHGAI